MATVERLDKERMAYERQKPVLVAESEGKFALLHGDLVCGVWETYESALQAGYDAFGLDTFLVKKIERHESAHVVRRDIACR